MTQVSASCPAEHSTSTLCTEACGHYLSGSARNKLKSNALSTSMTGHHVPHEVPLEMFLPYVRALHIP